MRHLSVGQPEAVKVLIDKNLDLLDGFADGTPGRRLRRAISRADKRYRQISTPDTRGFYHGLITGYAVAMKVLQGKVGALRSG
ncbi:MAG TPA: hypothetical protein VGZ23_06910 [bacterium]|nr:hypothetical protein [bacterium]